MLISTEGKQELSLTNKKSVQVLLVFKRIEFKVTRQH